MKGMQRIQNQNDIHHCFSWSQSTHCQMIAQWKWNVTSSSMPTALNCTHFNKYASLLRAVQLVQGAQQINDSTPITVINQDTQRKIFPSTKRNTLSSVCLRTSHFEFECGHFLSCSYQRKMRAEEHTCIHAASPVNLYYWYQATNWDFLKFRRSGTNQYLNLRGGKCCMLAFPVPGGKSHFLRDGLPPTPPPKEIPA